MNKAFLFDMDGVLIDNEKNWADYEEKFYPQLFGEEIARQIGNTTGLGLDAIYEKAVSLGLKMDKQEYLGLWDEAAQRIYVESQLTPGTEELAHFLIEHDFKLGLVSASPLLWVNWVLERLSFKEKITVVISIHERPDLKHKPAPDGYVEAINRLGASPETAIILEDSNTGIAAAKAAGAFVIGFKQNLIPGYIQHGADIYAGNVEEVIEIVKSVLKQKALKQKAPHA